MIKYSGIALGGNYHMWLKNSLVIAFLWPDCTLPASTLLLDFFVSMDLSNTTLLYSWILSLLVWGYNFWRRFNMIGQVGKLNGTSDLTEVLKQMIIKLGWNCSKSKNFPASEESELAVHTSHVHLKVPPQRSPRIKSHNRLLCVYVFLLVLVWNNESNYKSCLMKMLIILNAF